MSLKWLPGLLPQQTKIKSSIKLFPKYPKKVTKLGLEVLTGQALSVWFEFIDETVKTFFVFKRKLSLSLTSLYLAYMFINKLTTKFNSLFYRMILNTKRIYNSFRRNFPAIHRIHKWRTRGEKLITETRPFKNVDRENANKWKMTSI